MTIDTRLMVMAINEFERCGRLVAAGLGIVQLRRRYDTWWRDDLAPDERTWRDYTAKHLSFGADRAEELFNRMTASRSWRQSFVAFKPPALNRAMIAIAASPEKSNRAIAKEIGVSEPTVRRARQSLATAA